MKVRCEASGLKIGVDNSVTEALVDGNWGVRITFSGLELNNRYEVVLDSEEAISLVDKIQASMKAIQEVKKQQGIGA